MDRKIFVWLIVSATVGVSACAKPSPAAPDQPASNRLVKDTALPPPSVIVGGYTDSSPVNEAEANQKAARDFAVAEIYKKFPQRGRVESSTVKTQVVAGLNYQFHIVMTGGNAYDAVVYRDLQDHMSVTSLGKTGG
ncbi:MAG: hypothetical protein ABI624_07450 [Casimicrobiaceae bacterium]